LDGEDRVNLSDELVSDLKGSFGYGAAELEGRVSTPEHELGKFGEGFLP
jgi:hypothetical protein